MTHWGDPYSDEEYPDSDSDSDGFEIIIDSDYTDTEPLDSDWEQNVVSSLSEEDAHTPVLQEEELHPPSSKLRRTDSDLSRVQPKKVPDGSGVEVPGLQCKHGSDFDGCYSTYSNNATRKYGKY